MSWPAWLPKVLSSYPPFLFVWALQLDQHMICSGHCAFLSQPGVWQVSQHLVDKTVRVTKRARDWVPWELKELGMWSLSKRRISRDTFLSLGIWSIQGYKAGGGFRLILCWTGYRETDLFSCKKSRSSRQSYPEMEANCYIPFCSSSSWKLTLGWEHGRGNDFESPSHPKILTFAT